VPQVRMPNQFKPYVVEIPLAAMAVGVQRGGDWPASRHIGRCAASQSPVRIGLLPLPREEFRLLKLILRRRAASRRALPCTSS